MYNNRFRKKYVFSVLLIVNLVLIPFKTHPQTEDLLKTRVDNLVHKHYFRGIPYLEANSLGPDAVPYLLEMLRDPSEKQFWVNIIVTLGHIESSEPFDPLVSFLENTEGEVDIHTFKALLSVPFAIGCIASTGDPEALNYLIGKVFYPSWDTIRWSFMGKNLSPLLSEQAIAGLAVSGRAEAKEVLLDLKRQIDNKEGPPEQETFMPIIRDGLRIMDRIDKEGRSGIFNP